MNYPIYRKYAGIDTWFKITDPKHFIEIKKIGNRFLISEVEAIQFPELLFIKDMIALHEQRWEEVDQHTVEELLTVYGN